MDLQEHAPPHQTVNQIQISVEAGVEAGVGVMKQGVMKQGWGHEAGVVKQGSYKLIYHFAESGTVDDALAFRATTDFRQDEILSRAISAPTLIKIQSPLRSRVVTLVRDFLK